MPQKRKQSSNSDTNTNTKTPSSTTIKDSNILTDFPTHSFPNILSFESFLETHHNTLPGLYLKLAKKSFGIPSITAPEAVEVALCFGWIDGRANSLDENHWTVRYTPRRAKSLWSAKNVNTVSRLIAEGRMRAAGLETVEMAKEDGRWQRAYSGPAGIQVPDDLESALSLKGNEEARRVWQGLKKSERWPVLHRLQVGSRDVKKREAAIEAVVEMLGKREISSLQRAKTAGDKKSFRVEKKTVVKKGKPIQASEAKVSKEGEVSPSSVTTTRQLRSRRVHP